MNFYQSSKLSRPTIAIYCQVINFQNNNIYCPWKFPVICYHSRVWVYIYHDIIFTRYGTTAAMQIDTELEDPQRIYSKDIVIYVKH